MRPFKKHPPVLTTRNHAQEMPQRQQEQRPAYPQTIVSASWQQPVDRGRQSQSQNIPAVWNSQEQGDSQIRQVAGQIPLQPAPQPVPVPPDFGTTATSALSSATLSSALSSNPVPKVTKNVALRKINADDFEQRLLASLGKRFVKATRIGNTADMVQYQLPLGNGQRLELSIDRRQNIVSITGAERSVDSFVQITTMLDDDGTRNNVDTAVLPYNQSNAPILRDMAQILARSSQGANVPPENRTRNNQAYNQAQRPQTQENGGSPDSGNTQLRFRADGGQTSPPQSGNFNPDQQLPDASGLVGPVSVNILDGDVLVIHGSSSDVALVISMIEQLEQISTEHEPLLETVYMQHGDCTQVASIMQQLYTQIYQSRKGRLSAVSLVRPNAILLIGYEGSIGAAKELIAKLDIPIDAESQFKVFPLRHASCDMLKTSLDSLYTARTGTGAAVQNNAVGSNGLVSTVNIVSDYRTNSLIVQASQRDMLEIASMILTLDVADSSVRNEIKIIPLRNTRADVLASTVMQAITGRTSTTGTMGGSATQQQTGERSSGLSFATIDAAKGEKILESGLFTDVRIVADSAGNKLIVSAPSECMPLLEAIIQNLDDSPLAVAQVKVFTIINSDASSLLSMLNNIFPTSTAQGGAAANNAAFRIEGSTENSALIPIRFAAEPRTNSIIATGSADMLAMVEAILTTLDEPDTQNRRVMVYRLLNTPASTIATTLQQFLQNERQIKQQSGVLVGEVDIFNSEIIVTAETQTNCLLISTTPRYFEQIRKIIQVLDERPPMVQIQVLIAEVELSNANELGFELGLQDNILFNRSTLDNIVYGPTKSTTTSGGTVVEQSVISSTRVPGFNFNDTTRDLGQNATTGNTGNVGAQGISNFGLGRQNSELGYGGFVFSASSDSVSVLVRALEENKRLRVLNRPVLTALHNQASYLQVGQLVPTITNVSVTDTGGQQNSVEDKEVGVMLRITPRISLDDTVAMQIDAQKTSMDSEANGTPIFVQGGVTVRAAKTNSAMVQTTVSTKNGQVAVIGGLITEEEQSNHRAVPFVSNIPVLGQLFQYNYKSCTRKELLFILKPQIIRSSDELNALKNIEMARMHWCATHVSNLINDSTIKIRTDDFTSAETQIERGRSDVILDQHEVPSDDKVIEASPKQDLPLPRPLPGDPKK
ncbi:MAG: hypothetical protein FWC50_08710 [Planctomycetaceae bacterium]|nr:hypothetical protein [Planctomycetaceae bacterium]